MKRFLTALGVILIAFLTLFGLSSCGNNVSKVKTINIDLSSEQYAFAMKKGSPLKKSVDAFMTEKKEDIDKIFDKYLNGTVDDLASFGDASIKTSPSNNDNELVIATNLDFKPFEYKNGNKIAGIDMEIAMLLASYLNKELVVVNMDFDAVVTSVETKEEYHLGIAGLTITEERQAVVDFSAPYFDATQVLIVKENDTRFDNCKTSDDVLAVLKSLEESNSKCGGQAGTTSQFYIEGNESLGFDGYNNLSYNAYSSSSLAVKDMINGNISFVISDKATAKSLVDSINSQSIWSSFHRTFITNGGYKTVLYGLKATALIAVFSFLIGIFLGTIIACIRLSNKNNIAMKIIKRISDLYLIIFRGTPIVVQLLVIYYVLLPLMGIQCDNLVVAIITFGLNSAAYVSEIMRAGILSVDKGQTEAGRSLALSYPTTMLTIVFPQALKNSLPTLGNELITLVKDTSVVSFIAVTDLTQAFRNIGSSTYEFTIPYLMLALIYLVIVLALTGLIKLIERRLRKSEE